MNILVTGANGQLGNEMQIVARESGDKYIYTDVCDGYQKLDITDLDAVVDFVNANDIRCIINCAAWTNVDGAEDPAKYPLVEALNAKAPENLAVAMQRVGGLLVHVSTDYVFGGDPYNIPCKEDQKGTPTGVYGATKLRGEQNIINVMGAPPAPMWGSCQDGAAIVDANSQQPSMLGSCQDGAAIVDANSQQPSMLGSCQDGAAIVDANSQQPSMLRSCQDGAAIVDANSQQPSMLGSCQDGAAIVDANSQQPSMWGSCQDGAAIVDANSQQPSMWGSRQDGAANVDANSQQPSMLGSCQDGAANVDANSQQPSMWGSCQDGAANVDANSQQPSMWGSCQDGAAIVDANSQQPSMLGSCQDGAAIVDANSQQPSMLGSPEVCATPSGKSISYNLRPTFNADPVYYVELKQSAKYNRNHPTEAERLMWDILSGKQLEGYKFRRQHIIGQYIADFACLQEKLVIEIDGGYHNHPDQKYYDEIRSSYILSQGYRIIRFTNNEVFSSLDKVIAKIISELEQHTHTDSAPSKLTSGEEHPHMGAMGAEVPSGEEHPHMVAMGAITNVDHPSITEAGNKEAKLTSGEEHPHMGAMGAEVPSGEEHPHMGAGGAYIILRTAWLYSEFGKNFVKTMLNLTSTKPQLRVVFDQTGTPTYAYDLASAIFDIVENRKYEGNSGIYHYSNEGVCSWYDFTKMIAEYSGHTACDIQPCHSNEFPSPVKRPAYSVLDKTKIKQTFGTVVPYWTDSLRICLERMKSNR